MSHAHVEMPDVLESVKSLGGGHKNCKRSGERPREIKVQMSPSSLRVPACLSCLPAFATPHPFDSEAKQNATSFVHYYYYVQQNGEELDDDDD